MKNAIIDQADQVIAATYLRQPLVIERGQGCFLYDTQGRRYLDFVSGIAVCNLGHAHPGLGEVLARQAASLVHVSNLYYTIPQTQLAAWLVAHSFADRVFFCNSGAEANEAAIKLARRFFFQQGKPERHRIVSMRQSFHGRTMATLSATGQDKIKKGFAPVLEGFDFVDFNDLGALAKAIGPATAAVLLEPIQGEGGIRCPDPGYLAGVRKLCDETGTLMILDEIQTGIGRTGKLFAHEHFGVFPDIMTLAKALANGFPIGAMLSTETVAAAFGPGAHASTFGGGPVICALALEVLRLLTEDKIIDNCRQMGQYFIKRLQWLKDRHGCVAEIRGMGLLLGLKLDTPGAPVIGRLMEKGFLVNCVQEDILRLVPPLIVDAAVIDALVQTLDEVLD